jgi:CubicO group peptidase (beta-lactamase class C family)
MDAYAASLAALPLIRQPGEGWLYDTPMQLLGVLLERAADQPLRDVLAGRLFEPLGMVDTGFSVPADKLHRLPACYWRNQHTGALELFDPAGPDSRFARPPGFASAAGGLVSTLDDYAAFARMMANRGSHHGREILPGSAVTAMTIDWITPAQKAVSPFGDAFWDRRGWGYGLSVVLDPRPDGPPGFGWDGGYGTSAYWDPETGLLGLLLTQRLMESPDAPPVFRDFWRTARTALGA